MLLKEQSMGRLIGKTCLVTAAGQGIGRSTALAFASEGARVIATDINKDLLSSLEGVETRRLDVLDKGAVDEIGAEFSEINCLFNCAGFVAHGSILECSEEDWDFSFNINVKATYRVTRAFLPGMIKNKGGSIINMSSVVSSALAAPDRCAGPRRRGASQPSSHRARGHAGGTERRTRRRIHLSVVLAAGPARAAAPYARPAPSSSPSGSS